LSTADSADRTADAFVSAGFECLSLAAPCSMHKMESQTKCGPWGAPYLHADHFTGSTASRDGLASPCYYGNEVASCQQVPVSHNHRRLCACKHESDTDKSLSSRNLLKVMQALDVQFKKAIKEAERRSDYLEDFIEKLTAAVLHNATSWVQAADTIRITSVKEALDAWEKLKRWLEAAPDLSSLGSLPKGSSLVAILEEGEDVPFPVLDQADRTVKSAILALDHSLALILRDMLLNLKVAADTVNALTKQFVLERKKFLKGVTDQWEELKADISNDALLLEAETVVRGAQFAVADMKSKLDRTEDARLSSTQRASLDAARVGIGYLTSTLSASATSVNGSKARSALQDVFNLQETLAGEDHNTMIGLTAIEDWVLAASTDIYSVVQRKGPELLRSEQYRAAQLIALSDGDESENDAKTYWGWLQRRFKGYFDPNASANLNKTEQEIKDASAELNKTEQEIRRAASAVLNKTGKQIKSQVGAKSDKTEKRIKGKGSAKSDETDKRIEKKVIAKLNQTEQEMEKTMDDMGNELHKSQSAMKKKLIDGGLEAWSGLRDLLNRSRLLKGLDVGNIEKKIEDGLENVTSHLRLSLNEANVSREQKVQQAHQAWQLIRDWWAQWPFSSQAGIEQTLLQLDKVVNRSIEDVDLAVQKPIQMLQDSCNLVEHEAKFLLQERYELEKMVLQLAQRASLALDGYLTDVAGAAVVSSQSLTAPDSVETLLRKYLTL